MPITDVHPDYARRIRSWTSCRDAIEGEEAIKAAGPAYLPRLDDQSDTDYNSYKMRALFYGASERTVRGLVGAILRKETDLVFPEAGRSYLDHITLDGDDFSTLENEVLFEVVGIGRVGCLIDAPSTYAGQTVQPYVAVYYAENITNWGYRRTDAGQELEFVVLMEKYKPAGADRYASASEVQYRELTLEFNQERGQRVYRVNIWQQRSVVEGDKETLEWYIAQTKVPTIRGEPLTSIPFRFINSSGVTPEVNKPPIADLVYVNISHYRNSADLEHGRHFTALPTAWVAGFDPGATKLLLGSRSAWVTDNAEAKAGFLEFTGAGLGSLSEALREKEKLMAILGARLLEEQAAQAEQPTSVRLRQSGEQSVLSRVAQVVSQGLTEVLRLYASWVGAAGEISVKLNQDFNLTGIDSQTIMALMNALQAGAISWETWFYNLKRGEITPDHLTPDQERALIEAGGPQMMLPTRGEPTDAPDKPTDNPDGSE